VRHGLPTRKGISARPVVNGVRADRHTDREHAGPVTIATSHNEAGSVRQGLEAVRSPSIVESNTDKCGLGQENRERFIDQTLNVFQRRSPRSLTREDAREIAENVTGFFEILMRWEAQSGQSKVGKNS
jgi:hypothetical protein